ncbi:MAG TPA: hypothetical protein VFY65_12930, partial [Longimicrobium sp.]|nr:hypothetical protein [Longimicrobium sp.]
SGEEPPATGEVSAAPEGGAGSMDASGYLIGGGGAGEPPPPDGGFAAADVDMVDSSDFLVGDKSVAEMGDDPGDLPDDVVDEEASEGHA